MQSLLKCLIVRNSVVLAVYLLFSVACFFTVHEHSDKAYSLREKSGREVKKWKRCTRRH